MPLRLRITRSLSAVSAGTVSARETAARTAAIAPIRAGSTARRWRGTTSVSGRANEAVTAANAWSEVMSPTSTPEIVTPLAIVAGVGGGRARRGRRRRDHARGQAAGGGQAEQKQQQQTRPSSSGGKV